MSSDSLFTNRESRVSGVPYGTCVPYDLGMTATPQADTGAAELSITGVRDHIAEVVNRARYTAEITYITRHGQRLAAIVPADMAEAIERAEDALDVAAARDALADPEPPIPLAQLKAELGL